MKAPALRLLAAWQLLAIASASPDPDPALASQFPRYTPGGAQCSREHISDALRGLAPCTPRDKVIAVPWPNNTDIHRVSPSHVLVRRCSGGCHASGQGSCVATRVQVRSVAVMLGRCPVGGGQCAKECARLQVEDEVECGCGCPAHLQADCSGPGHAFNKEACQCECRDQAARRRCGDTPSRVWDSSACQCRCLESPGTAHCGPGLRYSEASCSCQPQGGAEEAAMGQVQRGDRASLQPSHLPSHWPELALITGLATSTVLLAIVCAALIRRIHRLQARLRDTRASHVKADPNLYSPGPGAQLYSPGPGEPSPYESQQPRASPLIRAGTQLGQHKMLELYSSSSSEVSSERQTDCSYYTDTSLALTPPPGPAPGPAPAPCPCLMPPPPPDCVSECSTLLGRETNV